MRSPVWDNDDCPVTQPYGCTTVAVEPVWPACPSDHFHCGIDVDMDIGTPLVAARGGQVLYVGPGLLEIGVGNGEYDWYVHIDKVAPGISAFSGNSVSAGELVAFSGNIAPSGGFTTGPHLHFEVQRGSWLNEPATAINPAEVLMADNVGNQPWTAAATLQAYITETKQVLDSFFGTGGADQTVPSNENLAAIWAKLNEMDSKLDQIIKALPSGGTTPTTVTGTFTGEIK